MTKAKGGTNATKDVIYVDVDDEITSIIDKVQGSDKKIVALVLPKRATVLQSVVNMKLLKRSAGLSKKNLVLITSESGLLPLAGAVGIHVAKSLNSKPEVPEPPAHMSATKAEPIEEVADTEGDDADAPAVDKTLTVGELAGATALPDDDDETIELDDEEDTGDSTADDGKGQKSKHRKFKIPNFNKFRVLLILAGVGVILLGVGVYAAVAVLPEAKITIKTDSTAVNSSLVLEMKTGDNVKLDVEKRIIQAKKQELKKTLSQEVAATGQKNNGKKATGEIEIINCTDGDALSIPAGTIVSNSGVTFTTDEEIFILFGNTDCDNIPGASSKKVDITAVSGGTKGNVKAGEFVVAGFSARTEAHSSAATKGGTDDIVKVVSQADIDNAKQKIAELDDQEVRQELKQGLVEQSLFAVEESLDLGKPKTQSSVPVNEEADSVTVTQEITYTMLGVKQEDLEKILDNDIKDKIDTKKQSITDYGLDEATFGLQETKPDSATVSMEATVVAGAELDTAAIKQQVAGKKAGDAKSLISANPGVTEVEVEYSPFWVSSIPSKTSKITIVVQEPKVAADEDASP